MSESRGRRRRPPQPTEPHSRTKQIWAFLQTVLPAWWVRGAAIVSALLAMSGARQNYTHRFMRFAQQRPRGFNKVQRGVVRTRICFRLFSIIVAHILI